jgi:flavin reductase (DIM6/NTAB) family NADH-FMN oxidoreductase RutF
VSASDTVSESTALDGTALDGTALDGAMLRQAFGCFPSGVTAVCALVDGGPVGMAASSFTSVSLDPPLVSVCVASTSATWGHLRTAERLGVSVMSSSHEAACRSLSARDGDRFAGVDWYATDGGAVLLREAPATLDCSLEAELPAGDHHIALLRIHSVTTDHGIDPLVFHRSKFTFVASPST